MSFSLNCRGVLRSFNKPIVMGIVNLNDNSFYADSRTPLSGLRKIVDKHIEEGAEILDLGASSSKPGTLISSPDDELSRLIPAIESIRKNNKNIILSVDTYHASVAEECLKVGADMINDISAGNIDDSMLSVIKKWNCPYVIMHMQGNPENMQENPNYQDVVKEVYASLHTKAAELRKIGISDIIIDPGFGFGKSIDHNFELLNNLEFFQQLNMPVLVGLSRKSMIYKTLETDPSKCLNGTTICNTIAIRSQAQILRVHDVMEAVEIITLNQKLNAQFN